MFEEKLYSVVSCQIGPELSGVDSLFYSRKETTFQSC